MFTKVVIDGNISFNHQLQKFLSTQEHSLNMWAEAEPGKYIKISFVQFLLEGYDEQEIYYNKIFRLFFPQKSLCQNYCITVFSTLGQLLNPKSLKA